MPFDDEQHKHEGGGDDPHEKAEQLAMEMYTQALPQMMQQLTDQAGEFCQVCFIKTLGRQLMRSVFNTYAWHQTMKIDVSSSDYDDDEKAEAATQKFLGEVKAEVGKSIDEMKELIFLDIDRTVYQAAQQRALVDILKDITGLDIRNYPADDNEEPKS